MTAAANKQTQNQKVLTHLKTIGPLTPLEAMREYGIMRLAARVLDLRRAGHEIEVKTIPTPTRDRHVTAHVAQYSMKAQAAGAEVVA